ncbi:winged helix-turn-helix domain-containing protein (plasmid) [Streptomyces sp. NBC_00868]|nr:winged helix-turn-helix domain-containing protein [Streptomyces sp. NBC_00868]
MRMEAVAMFASGRGSTDIAKELRVSVRSVQRWRQAWKAAGPGGVRSRGPPSRPKMSNALFAVLEEELAKGPVAHGWPDQRWTLARIKSLIGRRFHKSMTLSGISQMLRRHGWLSKYATTAGSRTGSNPTWCREDDSARAVRTGTGPRSRGRGVRWGCSEQVLSAGGTVVNRFADPAFPPTHNSTQLPRAVTDPPASAEAASRSSEWSSDRRRTAPLFLTVGMEMERIDEQHIAEPGLVVLDITGGGEDTRPGRHGRVGRTLGKLGHRPHAPGSRRARSAGPGLRRRPASGAGRAVGAAVGWFGWAVAAGKPPSGRPGPKAWPLPPSIAGKEVSFSGRGLPTRFELRSRKITRFGGSHLRSHPWSPAESNPPDNRPAPSRYNDRHHSLLPRPAPSPARPTLFSDQPTRSQHQRHLYPLPDLMSE